MAFNFIHDIKTKPSPFNEELLNIDKDIYDLTSDINPNSLIGEQFSLVHRIFKLCAPHPKIHQVIFTPLMIVFLVNVFLSTLLFNYFVCDTKSTTQVCGQTLMILTWGGLVGSQVKTEIWRIVTHSIHHFSFSHIIFNCICLFAVGHLMEVKYGTLRITIIYFASVIGGGLWVWLITPNSIVAGASAGIYGLYLLMLVDLVINTETVRYKRLTTLLILMAPLSMILDDVFNTGVSIVGHLGGAIGSILISTLIIPNYYYKSYEWIFPIVGLVLSILQFIILPMYLFLS